MLVCWYVSNISTQLIVCVVCSNSAQTLVHFHSNILFIPPFKFLSRQTLYVGEMDSTNDTFYDHISSLIWIPIWYDTPVLRGKMVFTVVAEQSVNSAKVSNYCPTTRLVKNNNYKIVTALVSRLLRPTNVRHDVYTSSARLFVVLLEHSISEGL